MFDTYLTRNILRLISFLENLVNFRTILIKYRKKNIDNFINDQFNYVQMYSMQVNENNDEQFLKNEYSEKF